MIKCELCQTEIIRDTFTKKGNGRAVRGVYLCRACEPSRSVISKYTNYDKAHLTDNERAKLIKESIIK